MEMEEIQSQVCKFPRIDNGSSGRNTSNKLGQYIDEDEDGEISRRSITNNVDVGNEIGYARLRGWHHSSRIFRVSRASGGKDRHSKVLTSKGLRDRRVRLSVATAIQFYDLQDRLGYDQPSKAVEWLIKKAADSISELPSLNSPFPTTPPKQLSDEQHHQQQYQPPRLSKSACSSTSETSKGSGLTLSKSDARVNNRVKARERARERSAAKEKKENEYVNANPISENSSFTDLLNSCNNNNTNGSGTTTPSAQQNPIFFHKSAPMDYFTSARALANHSSLFSSHMHQQSMAMTIPPPFSLSVENNNNNNNNNFHEVQHFSLVPESLIPVAVTNGNEYNLNFSISSSSSSGLAGFNSRGTLQSNSPPSQQPPSLFPHHHNLQRFSSMDGTNVPFFMGTTAPSNLDNNIQHHHLFPPGFGGHLQLYYGDHSDHKGKGKN